MSERIPQTEIDKDAYLFVINAKKHFEEQRRQAKYVDEWLSFEDSYHNGSSGFYSGLAKVRVPALHNAVERIVPKLLKGTFPLDGKWFDAEPDNVNDTLSLESAELAVTLLKDQFRDVNVKDKFIGLYRDLCIYGTVFVKVYWENKIKERYKYDENGKRYKAWDTLYDNPDFYVANIWDIYADIKDENLEGLVVERIIRDYQELWDKREHEKDGQKIGIYKNVKQLKDLHNPKMEVSDPDKQVSEQQRGLDLHSYGSHEHKVETYECWGMIPLWFITGSSEDKEEQTMVDGLIVIAAGENGSGQTLLIRDNPFDHQEKPYLRSRYLKVNGRLYGLGVMSNNIPLEHELNTLRNQAMDMRTFNLRPKWLRLIGSNISDIALKDVSLQVIDTLDMNALQPLRPNDFSPIIIPTAAMIQSDIEDGTGAPKLLGGIPAGQSLERTSGGISTFESNALDKIELVAQTTEVELLIELANKFWQLDQQFLPNGREISIVGREMIRVNPREISLPKINFKGLREMAAKEFKINSIGITLQNADKYAQYGVDPVPLFFEQVRLQGYPELIPLMDKRPNSEEILEDSPEGEIQLLKLGRKVKINLNDRHEDYIAAYKQLLSDRTLPDRIRFNTEEALGQRELALEVKRNPAILKNVAQSRTSLGMQDEQRA